MKRAITTVAVVLLVAGCKPSSQKAATPSVSVTLERPTQGSLPDLLTAYGSAAPSVGDSQTLSVPQAGQVTKVATITGQAVKAGQILIVFTVDPAALSTYEQATSALTAAQKQRETTAHLLSQQLATRDQLAQADKAVTDAVAALEALRRTGGGEAVHEVKAPFDGIVTSLAVAQGDRTQPGVTLLTVVRDSALVVTVGVDPAARGSVQPGQDASIMRLTGGEPLAGKVLRVSSALNPKTRQIDVDLGVPVGTLLPGEALRAGIRIRDISGWLVPHNAVVTANGDAHVFQVANDKAVLVKVTIALSTPERDVIQGAIEPSRNLIVEGAYQVEDGSTVRSVAR